MTRNEIEVRLTNYFKHHELVDRQTYQKFGTDSWQFFDTDTLHTLLIFREGIDKPFQVNNWFWNGRYDERGLRTNICDIVYKKTIKKRLYLSGHILGKAFDFKVTGMSSDDVRKWAVDNAHLFPCKIRLEHKILETGNTITWVHFDTKHEKDNPKVYLFNI